MDHPAPVCLDERSGDGQEHVEGANHGQPTLMPEHVRERLALEQLHHEVCDAVVLTDVGHIDYVRMTDARGRLALPEETRPQFLVVRHLRQQHLDGDALLQAAVHRLVHLRHATAADATHELVAAEDRAASGAEMVEQTPTAAGLLRGVMHGGEARASRRRRQGARAQRRSCRLDPATNGGHGWTM